MFNIGTYIYIYIYIYNYIYIYIVVYSYIYLYYLRIYINGKRDLVEQRALQNGEHVNLTLNIKQECQARQAAWRHTA